MSAFKDDLAEKMKSPEFAYEFGRTERELEIVKLLEDLDRHGSTHSEFCAARHAYAAQAIALINGESVQKPAVSTNDGQATFTDKGENTCNHERTLDWSQHCDCGTRHRDCLDCDWTEPCKPEEENA